MPLVVIPESFAKAATDRPQVEAEQQRRLAIAGCVSSVIGETADAWVLTSTFESADTDEAAAAVAGATAPDALERGLRTALRTNELDGRSPYQLGFAAKAKSGASFGFMQGDLAAGRPIVSTAFRAALGAAGIAAERIIVFEQRLSVHLIQNPLAPPDLALVNGALDAPAGRAQVDAMDTNLYTDTRGDLARCLAVAAQSGRQVAPEAQMYMLLWINMSGPPTRLLSWLAGETLTMAKPVPRPGPLVDGPAMEAYLAATEYFSENPHALPHILLSVSAGMQAMA